MKLASLLWRISVPFLATCSLASQASEEWPYQQDIPQAKSVNIGMASDRPYDISRFLMARGANRVSINSQGTHIAFVSNVTGINQVWVMPLTGQAKQLTFGNGVSSYNWHPDGEQLLYAADNQGDEKDAYYLVSIDGTKEQIVLSHSKAYRSFGRFSKSGKRFSFASTERNGRDFDIYLHDLESNNSELIYQAEFGYFPLAWRPESKELLVQQTRGEDAVNLYILDATSKKLRTLYKPEIAANFASAVWHSNGERFYFASNLDGEMQQLMVHDMNTGKSKTLTQSDWDIEQVRLCNQEKHLIWLSNENGYSKLYKKDLNSDQTSQLKLPQGVFSLSCATDNSKLAVRVSSHKTPGSVYLVDLNDNSSKMIWQSELAGIDENQLVAPEVITFNARDGVQIQGLLYLPKTSSGKLPPVVIDIHGGPTAQARPSWQALTQYLVGKDIAVLDINVRGSTGFGKTYTRLDNMKKRLDSVRDLVDALAYLKTDNRVDTSKAGAMGGSYGGYMVNAVMGAYPDAFAAGASFVGVANWVRALQTASPGLKASDLIEYGDIREQQWQDFYKQNSPINTVNYINKPMLFQHGANDPRDPVKESDEMVTVLRDKGVDVTYLRFPDEGHSVRKLANRVIFYRELAEFLEQNLMQPVTIN